MEEHLCGDLVHLVTEYVFQDALEAVRLNHLESAKWMLYKAQRKWLSFDLVAQVLRLAIASDREPLWRWAIDEMLNVCKQLNVPKISTPLEWAAASGRLSCLKALSALTVACPTERVMDEAIKGGQLEVVKWLLQSNILSVDSKPFKFELRHFAMTITTDNIKLCKFILKCNPKAYLMESIKTTTKIRSIQMYNWLKKDLKLDTLRVPPNNSGLHLRNLQFPLEKYVDVRAALSTNSWALFKLNPVKLKEQVTGFLKHTKDKIILKVFKKKDFRMLTMCCGQHDAYDLYRLAIKSKDLLTVIWVHKWFVDSIPTVAHRDMQSGLKCAICGNPRKIPSDEILAFMGSLLDSEHKHALTKVYCLKAAKKGNLDFIISNSPTLTSNSTREESIYVERLCGEAIKHDHIHIVKYCLQNYDKHFENWLECCLIAKAIRRKAFKCLTYLVNLFGKERLEECVHMADTIDELNILKTRLDNNNWTAVAFDALHGHLIQQFIITWILQNTELKVEDFRIPINGALSIWHSLNVDTVRLIDFNTVSNNLDTHLRDYRSQITFEALQWIQNNGLGSKVSEQIKTFESGREHRRFRRA